MEEPQTNPSTEKSSSKSDRLENYLVRNRLLINVLLHAGLFSVALLLAYLVRYEATAAKQEWFVKSFLHWLPLFLVVKLLVFGSFKLFRGGWQFASIRDVGNILAASWLSFFWCSKAV